jgi:CRP/FNR family transcriptional regulator
MCDFSHTEYSIFLIFSCNKRIMNLNLVFPNFDKPLIDHLLKIGEVVFIPAGETLVRPGQYFRNTILILQGRIKLYIEGVKGEEHFLYFLEEGNACALSVICSLRNEKSEIKAQAATNVKALMIPVQQMELLIKEYPRWYLFLLETYHSRFRELLSTISQIAFHSMDEKLAYYLKQQFESVRSKTISVTHQEIAADLNSSREVISRLLKKLENDNRIAIARNEITNVGL